MVATQALVLVLGASAALASPVKRQLAPAAPAPTALSFEASGMTAYGYSCPTTYSLVYAQDVVEFPDTDIHRAYTVLSNWGAALPGMVEKVNATASGQGAERWWSVVSSQGDVTKRAYANETLNKVKTVASPSIRLDQEWTSESLTELATVSFSNYTADLTLFVSETSQKPNVQLYINACADNATAGRIFLSTFVSGYVNGMSQHFNNASFPVSAN